MKVELNGRQVTTQAQSLKAFLQEQAINPATIATAANGEFVPRSNYSQYQLADGMRLEVLAPMQGG